MDQPPVPPPPLPTEETVAYPRPSETPVPRAAHKAADWLFWMAGLSVVNIIALGLGSQWSFFFSYGIADLVGAYLHSRNGLFAAVLGVVTFFVLAVTVIAGLQLKQGKSLWAYLILGPLALDCLLLFFELPYSLVSLGFHAYVVFVLFNAARELKDWNRVIRG